MDEEYVYERDAAPITFHPSGKGCPECGGPMLLVKRNVIYKKLLRQRSYASAWYECRNPDCETEKVFDPKFTVRNKGVA